MLGFNGKCPAVYPKRQILNFLLEKHKKSPVKHFLEKPILVNFVNLSSVFRPTLASIFRSRLSHILISNSTQVPSI